MSSVEHGGDLPGPVLAIVGPTGVGKTAVAELVALRAGGEVVSADSMQLYRGMDIGTAKAPADCRGVAHHCIDLIDPGQSYSAALYQRCARGAIDDILSRGLLPVVAGGTGLYVRAALDDWEFPPGSAVTERRTRLEREAADAGPEAMHERLRERDPASAELIHPRNVRRVIRALEMFEEGVSYATGRLRFSERRSVYRTVFVGLTMEREALYARIDQRVEDMLERGLTAEVTKLLDRGYREALTASQAIGYKEIVPVLDGTADLAEAAERMKRATRRYAKRQLTWFNADERIEWVDVTDMPPATAASAVTALLESATGERPDEGGRAFGEDGEV
jgi:tRNA dimethylallyltransferase